MGRAARRFERLEFEPASPAPVLEAMAHVAEVGDGWINLLPVLAEDPPEPRLRFFTLVGGGGPPLTMATWVRRADPRRDRIETSLGVAHRSGKRLVPQLVAAGHGVPLGWVIAQDHPSRGLVLVLPEDAPAAAVLDWALSALSVALGPRTARGWRAEVHH